MIFNSFLFIVGILSDATLGKKISTRGFKKKAPFPSTVDECDFAPLDPCSNIPLITGQNMDIGSVEVVHDDGGSTLSFSLEVDFPYILETVHYYFGLEPPQRQAPGKLGHMYKNLAMPLPPPPATHTFVEPHVVQDCYYLALHADVVNMDYEDQVSYILPTEEVQITLNARSGHIQNSYWEAKGSIFGEAWRETWCVELDSTIAPGTFNARLYSSLDPPDGLINTPNFAKVNWILNNIDVGAVYNSDEEDCEDFDGTLYSMGDYQNALWILLKNGRTSSAGIPAGTTQECHYNKIVRQAQEHPDYVPPCDGVVAIIIDPVESSTQLRQTLIAQTTIASIDVQCKTFDETAWAIAKEKCDFEQGWGSYFQCFCPNQE